MNVRKNVDLSQQNIKLDAEHSSFIRVQCAEQ